MFTKLESNLINNIIPAYQSALKDLAVHESRTFLADLLVRVSWSQGFAAHTRIVGDKPDEQDEYEPLGDLIKVAVASPTIKGCLQSLTLVGEYLDTHFAEAVQYAAHPTQGTVVDPADVLRKATELFE